MKFKSDYSSRFRILKGGKVSLVVSALLVSASLSTPANALEVDTAVTTTQSDDPNFADLLVTTDGSITITADGTDFTALYGTADIYSGQTVSNSGTISLTNTDQTSIMRGIFIAGYNDGTISNLLPSGTIYIDSTSTANNNGGGTAIQVSGNYGDITLDGGDITVTSVTNARGVFITGDHTGTITNSALLNTTVNTHPSSPISNQSIGIDITGAMSSASIVNSGTINSSSDRGVAASILVAGAVTDSTITNSFNINTAGTGSARAYGISLKAGTVGTTTITNDGGTITATNEYSDATGINIIGNSVGTITNSGTINVTGGSTGKGRGIYIDGDFNGNITNSSSILVDGDTTRLLHGINITGTFTGNLSSTFMEVTSNTADTVGIEVDTVAVGSTVTNSATLISHGDAWAAGIMADENYGIIETRSLLDVYSKSGNSYGIFLDGANEGTISTYARVKAESDDGQAFGIYVGDNNGDIVLETGSIEIKSVNAGWWTGGIMTYGGDGTGNIITKADTSITVNVSNNDYEAMGILSYDNNITNAGTISAYKDEILDESTFSINSTSTATHTVTNLGTLNGNLKVENGTLTNSGTVALPHNAYAEDWAWVGHFTNEAAGTLTIGLQTDGTIVNTTHSQLGATTATFADGSRIYVDVTAASTNIGNIAGERLDDVVWTNNGLTVDGTIEIDDNSALLDFEIIEDEDSILDLSTIDLNVVAATDSNGDRITVLSTTTSLGGGTTAQAGSKIIDSIRTAGGNSFTNKFSTLSGTEIVKAADEFTPQTAAAGVSAGNQIISDISGIVDQRQVGFIDTGINSGDEMFTERNFWMKPFGSIGSQNDKDGLNGFDVKTYGLGMGIDGTNKEDQQFGLGVFLTKGKVEVNNLTQKTDLDAYTVLAYGSSPVIDDKTRLLYQIGYTWQKSNMSKENLGETITADYTSKIASFDLKLLRDYEINEKLMLQPMITSSYKHFTNPAYSEKGSATSGAVDVNKYSTSELLVGLGTTWYYKLDSESKLIGNVNVDYDIQDKNNNLTYSYAGQTADVTSIDNGRLSYAIGLGYEREIADNSNLNFTYEYSGEGSAYSNNTISAKYVLKF